ncbi:MAG TPA: hypothetical protein QKA14_01380 [Candidatus Megaira endosymbiont of Hartmannula sinica]|nr:hypothetical protein [Candidatus Megaera endosymbiont of Hartmannula sinica]
MPQFDIDFFLPQVFWLVIVFSALYLIIHNLIVPAIAGIIENRKNTLNNIVFNTEKINEDISYLDEKNANSLNLIYRDIKETKEQSIKTLDMFIEESINKQLDEAKIKKQEIIAEHKINTEKFHSDSLIHVVDTAAAIIYKITNKTPDIKKIQQIAKNL